MSKRKVGQRRRPQARPSPRRGRTKSAVIAAVLCVAAAGAATARWRSLRPAHAPAPAAVTAAVQSLPAFAPERPSKEYVYAGSRLVATEEPAVKSDQSITFDAVTDKTYGDPAFAPSAAASSGLPVSFSVTSGPATVSGNVVTINGAGAVTVQAHQAGSDTFNPAPSVTRSFNVAKAGQTISFDATQLAGKTYGDAPFAITASSSSGLPVTFTAAGGVTVSGNTVTTNSAGAASVKASAAGDANHNAAADVEHPFTVAKAAAAVTLGSLTHTYDGAAKSATASTSPASLPVAISYTRDGSPIASPTHAGSYSVTATVNDNNYQGAASGTLIINKAVATVTVGSLAQTYDGAAKSASASTSPAGLQVTFAYTQSGSAVAAPTDAGSYDVTAAVSDANYTGTASGTLVINKAQATLTLGSLSQTYNGSPRGVAVSTSPAGLNVVSVTYNGSASAPTGAGSYSVVASLTNSNYTAADATGTLVVNKGTPAINWADPADITYGTPLGATQLNATASFNGAGVAGSFTYTPGAGSVLGPGNAHPLSVNFTPADSNNFNPAAGGASINVLSAAAYSVSTNGATDYLEVPNSSSVNVTSAFTAEAWVRLNSSTGTHQSIMERFGSPDAAGNNGGFILRINPAGKIEFFVLKSNQAGFSTTGGTLVTAGVWHHVAAVSDGTSMRVYLDGVLDGTLAVSYFPATGTSNLFVGRGAGEYGYFNGLIDEARLTAAALYAADFVPQASLTPVASTRGLWKFDGQSFNDFSGNGNTPAARGTPAYSPTVAALASHSVSFDGSTGRVQIPHSASLDVAGPFTAEAWFKINNTGTNQYLASCLTATGGFILMANQGMPQLYVTNAAGQSDFAIAWPPVITFNEWHHMAGVFDGSQLRVYLDGALVASKATAVVPGSFAGSQLSIGGYQSGGGWLSGLVDEARVSAGAVYTSNFTPKRRLTATASTRGLWKFDGQTLQDASGNSNNAAFTGGASYSTLVP